MWMLLLLCSFTPPIFVATGSYAGLEESRVDVSEYYAVMFTAPWCGSCKQYTNAGNFSRLEKVLPGSVLIDVEKHPEWTKERKVQTASGEITIAAVKTIPEFWLVRKPKDSMALPVKRWMPGHVSPEEIHALALELAQQD